MQETAPGNLALFRRTLSVRVNCDIGVSCPYSPAFIVPEEDWGARAVPVWSSRCKHPEGV